MRPVHPTTPEELDVAGANGIIVEMDDGQRIAMYLTAPVEHVADLAPREPQLALRREWKWVMASAVVCARGHEVDAHAHLDAFLRDEQDDRFRSVYASAAVESASQSRAAWAFALSLFLTWALTDAPR